jgi:hypothetical protein
MKYQLRKNHLRTPLYITCSTLSPLQSPYVLYYSFESLSTNTISSPAVKVKVAEKSKMFYFWGRPTIYKQGFIGL